MNDDPDNAVNSRYYSINEIESLKVTNKDKSPSMFHINACSLNKNCDNLKYLLNCTNKKFDNILVSETRITRNTTKLCNISLKNYPVESNHTESREVRILPYIANHLFDNPRDDSNIYKISERESTFVEIINPK